MKPFACCCLLFAVFLAACASSTHHRLGRGALEKEDYQKALVELRQAVKENPLNTEAVRDLGIVLFELKNYKSAALILEKVMQRWPDDGLTRTYLGAAYEQLARIDDAMAIYRAYPQVRNPEYRKQLSARLDLAIQTKLRQEARQALARESALDPQTFPENSIAVLNFRNLGGNTGFDALSKGLADMVITDLSQVKALTVIERSRMQTLLEEMGLGQSGLVDEQTAPRVGHLLGAKKILQGSFLDLAGGKLRLDANLTDIAAQASKPAAEISGELARFFRLEKNLIFKVIDELGIALTEAEEQAILTIPTENLLAFLAYSRGLDARDRGDYEKAQEEFQQALTIDPKFNAAKTQLARTGTLREARRDLHDFTRRAALLPRPAVSERRARLATLARNTNPGFGFANRGRVLALSKSNLPGLNQGLRQPLLEGRNDFGLKGDLVLTIELP